ncbi:hypothetical protein GKE82_02375 [Conexibacter sp. W3-3-2]|uniref:Helix-turn-helix domain-containing protein n=1 Tax=Paraconexibacter algicola TaxID=2133960 RepID=A0A2T4UCM6_9ACTN|nr:MULTISPECIES: helix-turn-helix domain-containing protein [Solirubrobacterales]MTD43180.1 hypothetical protein [Conexibacter sp. W3-3-2]PTL54931.1 hypothetical protein C7Y72_20370 [Paraconexibacter algicola]
MADIGATLREARMRARIDISEIEAETKIRAKYLRALENEEWDLLPGPTFVKTFLRTYADVLGLDSKLLVEEYKLRHERPNLTELRPIGAPQPGRRRPRPQPTGVPRGYVVGLVVVLLLGTLYLLGRGGGDDEPAVATTTQQRTTTDATRPAADATPAPSATPAATATATPAARTVRLRVVPTGQVFVCLTAAGGRTLIDGQILDTTSQTRTFRSSRFRITLGNAAARLRIDGKDRDVADNAEGIGYEITPGGKRRTLSPENRPVCDG